ncbi:MAG: hypothetical protein ABJL44_10395 [Algibacter sp.]
MNKILKNKIIFAVFRGLIYSGIFVVLDYYLRDKEMDLRKFLGGIIFFAGLVYIAEKIKKKKENNAS